MRTVRTRWTAAAGVVTALISATVLSSASAAQGATPEGLCGTGFGVVNSQALPNGAGTVYLLYNNGSGENCAVTLRSGSGGAVYMDVGLRHAGDSSTATWDHGSFAQYAGPVYLQAAGICVDWSGAIGDRSITVRETNCGA
ncbi:spore-associated protein [Marinitenerispora sediminis]|uniref:Spore-associated protein n=1 Tax=Marinitenerispora sediminis TaxID=1931232 RepID=A0A368T0L2_9ACTN|nr:spore-associated protein [Marinitenerispora sediminis]RCV49808.1 spore-associated protein [Marinitenerispora sediminis]RCV52661.1 spore-associated protein [Marinitenerispora sediminis]RCV55783.1 spore-associated protein [Marinitenerispora sediminis]